MHRSSAALAAASTAPAPRPAGAPARDTWYAKPVKVFDNLYFVGQTEYSAWAVKTPDGIIIIDPIFDYSVEEEVVNGLKSLGFDPTTSSTSSSATRIPITSAARRSCRTASTRK